MANMLPPVTRNVHSPQASFSNTSGSARQRVRSRWIAGSASSYMRGCDMSISPTRALPAAFPLAPEDRVHEAVRRAAIRRAGAGEEALAHHAELLHRPVRAPVGRVAHRLNAAQAEMLKTVLEQQASRL